MKKIGNAKPEIRNPKSEGNPKLEIRKALSGVADSI
jgi:hypothetical protein